MSGCIELVIVTYFICSDDDDDFEDEEAEEKAPVKKVSRVCNATRLPEITANRSDGNFLVLSTCFITDGSWFGGKLWPRT